MLSAVPILALFCGALVSAEDCTFESTVATNGELNVQMPFERDVILPSTFRMLVDNTFGSETEDACFDYSGRYGFVGRTCFSCMSELNYQESIGGFYAIGTSQTGFGRQNTQVRGDLLDIGFVDADGNRLEEWALDHSYPPAMECTCEGKDASNMGKDTCSTGLVCSTSAETEYGSYTTTMSSFVQGDIGSVQVNVSLVHTMLDGSAFIKLGVLKRFKKFTEEGDKYIITGTGGRIVLDSMCGENELTIESIELEPPRRESDFAMDGVPEHNDVMIRMAGTNATCDWSYTVEVELAKSAAAPLAASSLLLLLVALFL